MNVDVYYFVLVIGGCVVDYEMGGVGIEFFVDDLCYGCEDVLFVFDEGVL